jgi:hypothetical protein
MYCPNCGAEQKEGNKFCPGCGKDLTGSVTSPEPPPKTIQKETQESMEIKGMAIIERERGALIAKIGFAIAAFCIIAGPLRVILGPIIMVLGYIAWRKGEKSLGKWAIIIGTFWLIFGLFVPLSAQ